MKTTNNWYAMQVACGAEQIAANAVSKIVDDVSVSERTCYIRRKDRIVAETRQLFPGYVFVQLHELTEDLYYELLRCHAAIRLLGMQNCKLPEPIPETEMQVLQQLYADGSIADKPLAQKATRYADGTIVHNIPPGVEIRRVDARQRKAHAVLRLYDEDIYISFALEITDKRPARKPE